MGRCWRCDRELRLIGKQWLCDNCDEPIGYKCWNCGTDFTIRDSETKKNIKECSICGFYYCPNCQSCAENCEKYEWNKLILNILAGQFTLDGSLIISKPLERVRRIIQLIEDLKTEKRERKVCPYYVYASYARGRKGEQGRIKQLLAKMNGIGVRDMIDAEGFKSQFRKVIGLNEAQSFTINELRSDGRYGQEERDACNLGICMGELIGELKINKHDQRVIIYTKIKNKGKCPHLRQDNFVTKRCPHCNKDYNNPRLEYYQPNIDFCPKCIYKRGKKKDSSYKLETKETNTFICNCSWDNFTKIDINKEDDEDGGSEE